MKGPWALKVGTLVLLGSTIVASPTYAQGLRDPARLALEPIRGAADLSCEFQDPTAPADALKQGNEVGLLVTVKSAAGAVTYELTDAVQAIPEPPAERREHAIRMLRAPLRQRSYQDSTHREVVEYVLVLGIDASATPREYFVELKFAAPGKRPETRPIRLYVGARESAQFVDAAPLTSPPRITAGAESALPLIVSNKFPSYRLMLRRIEASSDPPGLVLPVKQDVSEFIPAGQSKTIGVTLRGERSWLRQLSPIEPKPKLNVLLVYNDGYRDDIERLPQIPIDFILDVDLTTTVLITAVTLLAGSLVGAWLRIKLVQAPADEQVLAVWERVLASVLLAGVIAVMVVIARVEILAQAASLQIPLHKPAGIFLIAFIVAVIDPSDWLRKVRDRFGPRSSGSSPAPAAPAVTKDVKP